MKVVKQNGVRHALTRREAEAIIAFFPPDWRRVVNSVVLYQTSGERVYARYYAKAKMLGLFWPSVPHPGLEKVAAIDEMLIAMMAVAEIGHLPERLPDIRPERVKVVVAKNRLSSHALVQF